MGNWRTERVKIRFFISYQTDKLGLEFYKTEPLVSQILALEIIKKFELNCLGDWLIADVKLPNIHQPIRDISFVSFLFLKQDTLATDTQ